MPSADIARAYAVMPIAVLTLIDAGTASSSPFHRTSKSVHDHAGIVFTFSWNPCSRCPGNREHHAPEYALYNLTKSLGHKIGFQRSAQLMISTRMIIRECPLRDGCSESLTGAFC
jgi:hypothetical protein